MTAKKRVPVGEKIEAEIQRSLAEGHIRFPFTWVLVDAEGLNGCGRVLGHRDVSVWFNRGNRIELPAKEFIVDDRGESVTIVLSAEIEH